MPWPYIYPAHFLSFLLHQVLPMQIPFSQALTVFIASLVHPCHLSLSWILFRTYFLSYSSLIQSPSLIQSFSDSHFPKLGGGGGGTSLVFQWLRLRAPNAGDSDSIPCQGTRSHMPQFRVHRPQLKILHAARRLKILCAQLRPRIGRYIDR